MSFDYFLNTKLLNKINKKLENNIFKTPLFYSTKQKLTLILLIKYLKIDF